MSLYANSSTYDPPRPSNRTPDFKQKSLLCSCETAVELLSILPSILPSIIANPLCCTPVLKPTRGTGTRNTLLETTSPQSPHSLTLSKLRAVARLTNQT